MSTAHFVHMQTAVDTIAQSPHPTNKVAACLAGKDYAISRSNFWPNRIENTFGQEQKIGNSSGTIHAETACIIDAPNKTEGASLYVTDPPCPNCMKNIAEAGIAHIYIDHKGFAKDFAQRRGHDFENMSMRICEKAGINLYMINRKAEKIEPIISINSSYAAPNEHPIQIIKNTTYEQAIQDTHKQYEDEAFALCLTKNNKNETICIAADKHPTIGYTEENVEKKSGKYSFILQPVNRLLMNAARHGLEIIPNSIYSSRTPTSRELVNMIGASMAELTIHNTTKSRDEFGPQALDQLTKADLLKVNQP